MSIELFSESDVRAHLREVSKEIGLQQFCGRHKLDYDLVNQVLVGRRFVYEDLANALGYETYIAYKRIKR